MRRLAKAMSASGQDQNGLGAQPASAVGEADLPHSFHKGAGAAKQAPR